MKYIEYMCVYIHTHVHIQVFYIWFNEIHFK